MNNFTPGTKEWKLKKRAEILDKRLRSETKRLKLHITMK